MSSLVEDILAENRETQSPTLDLGNCGLSSIPPEALEHHWVRELIVSSEWWEWSDRYVIRERWATAHDGPMNNIRSLPTDWKGLRGLRRLVLSGDLHLEFQLVDISSLSQLTKLEALYLCSTRVQDLSALRKIRNLRLLDLWGAESVTDIAAISGHSRLQVLDLWGTHVSDLSPLSNLTKLRYINIGETQVSDLSPLSTQLELGIEAFEYDPEEDDSEGVFFSHCPIERPPPEIVELGSESILSFLRESRDQGVDHLYEAKMLIVGEGGAGKTSLLRRLYQPDIPLPREDETTKGIQIHKHEFPLQNGVKFRLNVWDFGGQEIYHATHQFFLTKRSIYVLLDDTRRDNKTVHDEGFKYWLEVIEALSAHSPVLIFQNEKGGRTKVIDQGGIRGKFANVVGFYSGDLLDPTAATTVKRAIEHHVADLPHVGEELPAKWVTIRAAIERDSLVNDFISEARYFEIYSKHLPFDRSKALHLSRYLHDLGVFLHFQDDELLSRTLILQNDWATDAVFLMVDDNKVKAQFGRFTSEDCRRVWHAPRYARMIPELQTLMQRFELCYRLADAKPESWLLPQLLPPSRPESLANWEQRDDLSIKFRYEFLPKGIISRLIVRQHRLVVQPDLGWSSGALFQLGTSQALVFVSALGTEIVVRSRGIEKAQLLAILANEIDALNASFHGVADRVTRLIPCVCSRCRGATSPEFFEQPRLLQRRVDNKHMIECPRSYESVSVSELLDGIPRKQTRKAAEMKKTKTAHPARREIKIFLASSSELLAERQEIELYCRQLNDHLLKRDIYLKVVRWEALPSDVSPTRKQDDYNEALRQCDIVLLFFGTKAGDFTMEEFDTALKEFRSTGKPTIFTYLKSESILPTLDNKHRIESMFNLQQKLRDVGHFPNTYMNMEEFKRSFGQQLELWLGKNAP